MTSESFAGDKKDGISLLHNAEERLKAALIPCVPHGIETYHLTLTTIVWSILVVLFSWLATFNRQWMWGVSVAIIAQYITDLLDGAIGRKRDTGLVKWGYYMDHFLDYVFLCAMLIGYSLLIPNHLKYMMFFVMAVFCGFMVNSFLQFAATNKFKIAYWGIGPTEIRLVFILINTLTIFLNHTIYIKAVPCVLGLAAFGLFFTAFNTQRQLWAIDMNAKAEKDGTKNNEEDLQGLVLRHFLLSFIIASLAFLVLIAKIAAPFHKIIAGILYAVSWVPAISAFTHKSWIHVKNKPWVKKYIPLSIAALVLIVCAWIAFNLRPAPSPQAYSTSQIRANIDQDISTIVTINESISTLLDQIVNPQIEDSKLKSLVTDFMTEQQTLTQLIQSYESYYRIDRQENAILHNQAFLVWFCALSIQQNSTLEMMLATSSDQVKKAITIDSSQKIHDNGNFEDLLKAVLSPNTVVKIGYSTTHLRLITHTDSAVVEPSVETLKNIAQINIDAYYQQIESNKGTLVDALKLVSGLE